MKSAKAASSSKGSVYQLGGARKKVVKSPSDVNGSQNQVRTLTNPNSRAGSVQGSQKGGVYNAASGINVYSSMRNKIDA
jgi:hypothetical protein